jgi:hypothetical protein
MQMNDKRSPVRVIKLGDFFCATIAVSSDRDLASVEHPPALPSEGLEQTLNMNPSVFGEELRSDEPFDFDFSLPTLNNLTKEELTEMLRDANASQFDELWDHTERNLGDVCSRKVLNADNPQCHMLHIAMSRGRCQSDSMLRRLISLHERATLRSSRLDVFTIDTFFPSRIQTIPLRTFFPCLLLQHPPFFLVLPSLRHGPYLSPSPASFVSSMSHTLPQPGIFSHTSPPPLLFPSHKAKTSPEGTRLRT